jgi:hypothetical protein
VGIDGTARDRRVEWGRGVPYRNTLNFLNFLNFLTFPPKYPIMQIPLTL